MNSPLIVSNLTKRFGQQTALNAVSFEIPAGRVVGLLGRNGAGKSTLLNTIGGLTVPTTGSCVTLGMESRDLENDQLQRLGVVHQQGGLPPEMTVEQLCDFTASFYPRWDRLRQENLIARLELPVGRIVGHLSPGDQQKAAILLAVCHHPALLLLDEPISALDPIIRTRTLDFLFTLVREDACTILISSHILADVEKVVDWVLCLRDGSLVLSAPLDEMQENYAAEFGRAMSLEQIFPLLVQPEDAGR